MILLMFTGVVAFSFVSGAISSLMVSLDEQTSDENDKLGRCRMLQKEFKFSDETFHALMKNIGRVETVPETSWLVDQISGAKNLKRKICRMVYKKYENLQFLKLVSEDFKYDLIKFITENVTVVRKKKNDEIFLSKKVSNFYIVLDGEVEYFFPSKFKSASGKAFLTLKPNDSFGFEDVLYKMAPDDLIMLNDNVMYFEDYEISAGCKRRFSCRVSKAGDSGEAKFMFVSVVKLMTAVQSEFTDACQSVFEYQLYSFKKLLF